MRAPSPRAWWAAGQDIRSAGASEAVVVAAAVLLLFGLLLGLGLEQVGLARDLGRGVPVRLPVHLLGAAEEFLRLGLRLAPDAHGAILSQVIGLPAVSLVAMFRACQPPWLWSASAARSAPRSSLAAMLPGLSASCERRQD